MATYLLLRDNKQNGPFSFDELKAKGLKPYDLVWVEGRSAAWRYPGEVEELKPFAPQVEEQPYDRFFKRPSQENKPAATVATVRQNTVPEKETAGTEFQQLNNIRAEKSNVYVTLPDTKRSNIVAEPFAAAEPVKKEPVAKEPVKQEFVRHTVSQIPAALEEELHQPKEDLYNRQYNPNIQPVKKSAAFEGWKKTMLTAAAVVILLGTGVFIGLYISKNSIKPLVSKTNNTAGEESQAANQTVSIPVSAKIPDQKTDALVQDNTKTISTENIPVDKKPVPAVENKKINIPKEKTEISRKPVAAGATTDTNAETSILPILHREATHRTDLPSTPDKEAVKSTLLNQVSIDANKYSVGTFGGISELQLTVGNRSIHPLDLVVVEVQYLQANKKIFKTENMYFRNINAGAALMQEAPKSPRGIKVQYKIILINSKESGLSYSAI